MKIDRSERAPLYLVAFILWLGAAGLAAAGPQVPEEAGARLRAIYEEGAYAARTFRAEWLPDGSAYALLERVDGAEADRLVAYDAASGARSVLASLEQLTPPGAAEPLAVDDWGMSADGAWLLLRAETRVEDRERGRIADYWSLERSSGTLRRVVAGGDVFPVDEAFSPGGERVVYQMEGDLYVHELDSGDNLPLTTDGEPGAIDNGRWAWSPDGRRVAYVQSDSREVRQRPVLDPVDPSYPEVRYVRFARVGTTIPTLRVGVVGAAGGETRWLPVPTPAEGMYLGDVSWAGNGGELLVEKLSRPRDAREFLIVDVDSGDIARAYGETDPAWVQASYRVNAGLEWTRGGDAFVLLSERDGWRHAWLISRDGRQQDLLTPGDFDIIDRVGVDESRGWFYYLASPDDATQRYLYRVRLDGGAHPERVTPVDRPGSHEYEVSPDGRWALHTFSAFDVPPVTELVELPEHRTVRVLEDNAGLRERVAELISGPTEFLQLDIGEGVVMDAWMLRPGDFDPERHYPVLVYVYGEPHAQTVLDRWSGSHLYHRVIADLGYLVVSIDNRGTPAPKGARWRRAIFPSLGPLSTAEQAAGLRELGRTRPYVDLSRVGVWGWSGGGSNTLNAMFREPELYRVGIAVAPKPQPHLYNAWFQEIYMGTREDNPEGYRRSAPINFAEGLAGDLLIVHGTGETNTHLEITEGLVDRLIELGKPFEYMTYPHRDHGIRRGEGTSLHLRMLMTRYLLEHLPAGPR